VKADFAYCLWEEGDKLLLCTDGLVGFVEESEMCSILSEDIPIEQTVRELIGAANARGAEDNITALVLENTKENPSC
jgi:protein phosphatase